MISINHWRSNLAWSVKYWVLSVGVLKELFLFLHRLVFRYWPKTFNQYLYYGKNDTIFSCSGFPNLLLEAQKSISTYWSGCYTLLTYRSSSWILKQFEIRNRDLYQGQPCYSSIQLFVSSLWKLLCKAKTPAIFP